jgi:hypothetical protein
MSDKAEEQRDDSSERNSTMATMTFNSVGTAPARTGGLFRRALTRMMTARELQARRYVNDYLLTLDDATLAAYGIDRKTISNGIIASYPW